MTKLVRIFNGGIGEKLIVCETTGYHDFMNLVRTKFLLPEEAELPLQDEEGAEEDEEVLPILLQQATTPNLILYAKGEDTGATTFEVITSPAGQQTLSYVSSTSTSICHSEQDGNLFQQRDSAYNRPETSCFSICGNIAVLEIPVEYSRNRTLTSDGDPWDTIRRFTMKNLNSLGFGKKSTESLILSDIEELVTSLSKGVGKSLDFKDKFYIPATNHLWFILTGEEIRDKPYFRDALASLHKMPYTKSVMQEVLRISSTSPFSNFQMTTEDVTFETYFIPKGTTIIANLYGIHHDPNLYPEPEIFNPDRFLDETRSPNAPPFLPFSVGLRTCLGQTFARNEFFLLLVSLCQKFQFSWDPNVEKPTMDGLTEKCVSIFRFTPEFRLLLGWRSEMRGRRGEEHKIILPV
ncbi:probable cytochrome P450 4p3 [Folsomia candida]|uniref:probable cytochrome P450 4p3 n=1 Tax=Folsomia candida TaxID=158441 RepID=UPI000B8FDFE2|nr:probable cytochrome P450 4p3 [Folsomia candida]